MAEYRSIMTQKLAQIRPSATFLTVMKYRNNFDELSDFSICFHISYPNAVKKSQKILQALKIESENCKGKVYSLAELKMAREELLESYKDTLAGYNSRYTCPDTYDLVNLDGEMISGIKLHKTKEIIHLNGILLFKKVLKQIEYPDVQHSRFTLAKIMLKKLTPLNNYRQFKLITGRFEKIKVEKLEILPIETYKI